MNDQEKDLKQEQPQGEATQELPPGAFRYARKTDGSLVVRDELGGERELDKESSGRIEFLPRRMRRAQGSEEKPLLHPRPAGGHREVR